MSELLKALEDSDSGVRWRAAVALGKLGGDAAVPGLLKIFRNSNQDVCISALEAASLLKNEVLVEPIIKVIKLRGKTTRQYAAKALGSIGNSSSINPLTKALMVKALIEALTSKHFLVRRAASNALGKIAAPQTLVALWQMQLKAEHTDIVPAILAIQEHCGFYNYKVWQAAEKRKQADEAKSQEGGTVNYDLREANIGSLAHEVKGDQKSFQFNPVEENEVNHERE
jgi:hypothetical protein